MSKLRFPPMKLTQNGKFLANLVADLSSFRDGRMTFRLARPISARNSKLLEKNNKRRFVLTMDEETAVGFDGICVRVRRNLLEIAITSMIVYVAQKRKARRKANLKPNK